MIYKRILILFVLFLGSIFTIAILWISSSYLRIHKNNFVRSLPPHIVIPGIIMDLKRSDLYFSGCDRDYVYLGGFYIPNSVLSVKTNIKDSLRLQFRFSKETSLLKGTSSIVADSLVFVLDGVQPALFWRNLHDEDQFKKCRPPFFNKAIHIDKQLFILRVVINGNNWLVKYRSDSTGFKSGNTVLEKQVDGIFCTDGNLIKTPDSKRIFYIYHYRNQFLCSDTNLNLIYKGKTIDTNAHAKIKVSDIKSSNQMSLSTPPVYVNKQAAANNKFLFIVSGLRADNEKSSLLDGFSTIDVYNVETGIYKFSFYLPDFNGKKLTDFRVYGQSLYALYDRYLYKYQLNF